MTIEDYILSHTAEEPAYLKTVARQTHLHTLKPRMMCGRYEGRLLSLLCSLVEAKRILEIGTFTGYSALCMAEALPEDGELHTIDINDELEEFVAKSFGYAPELAKKIVQHTGDALEIIPRIGGEFDVAFIDGNKRHYTEYFEVVLPKVRKGGLIIADNTLWDGHVLEENPTDAQTVGITRFNDKVNDDSRVVGVILPVRDGMTILRKK